MFMSFTSLAALSALVLSLGVSVTLYLLWRRMEERLYHADLSVHEDAALIKLLQVRIGQLEHLVDRLRFSEEQLEGRFRTVEDYAGACVPPKATVSGFNINHRVEAIRLFRDGFREEEIAERLSTPLGEIRLLLYLEKKQVDTAKPLDHMEERSLIAS